MKSNYTMKLLTLLYQNMNQMKTHYNFTAQIEKDKETGLYVGMVPTFPEPILRQPH
jgi:hypothetical protein